MDATLIRTAQGLGPYSEDTEAWLAKIKPGAMVFAKVSQPRNPIFHRKAFALLKYAFDYWAETAPPQKYKGADVHPDFERFRRDITILAGHYHTTVNLKGEVRLEADSWAFGSMSAEQFETLYSKLMEVLLQRVFTAKRWNEEQLREIVDGLVGFA